MFILNVLLLVFKILPCGFFVFFKDVQGFLLRDAQLFCPNCSKFAHLSKLNSMRASGTAYGGKKSLNGNMVFLSLADLHFIKSGRLLWNLKFRKGLEGAEQGGVDEKGQAECLRDTVLNLLEKRNSPRRFGSDVGPYQASVVR